MRRITTLGVGRGACNGYMHNNCNASDACARTIAKFIARITTLLSYLCVVNVEMFLQLLLNKPTRFKKNTYYIYIYIQTHGTYHQDNQTT
jgi:hypothetical protein